MGNSRQMRSWILQNTILPVVPRNNVASLIHTTTLLVLSKKAACYVVTQATRHSIVPTIERLLITISHNMHGTVNYFPYRSRLRNVNFTTRVAGATYKNADNIYRQVTSGARSDSYQGKTFADFGGDLMLDALRVADQRHGACRACAEGRKETRGYVRLK